MLEHVPSGWYERTPRTRGFGPAARDPFLDISQAHVACGPERRWNGEGGIQL